MNPTENVDIRNIELVKKLGEGVQGAVYEAQDIAERTCAVKVEPPGCHALREEFRIYNVLRMQGITEGIPYIYGFYDGERVKPNKLFMELLGDSLETCMERDGFFDRNRVLALTRSGIRVLRGFHAAGVIHTDVALRNILLSRTQDDAEQSDIPKSGGDENSVVPNTEGTSAQASSSSSYDNTARTGTAQGAIASNKDDEKVYLVDFGFSLVYVTPTNPDGKERNPEGRPSFNSMAKLDVEMLLDCAQELVGQFSNKGPPLLPEVERAISYLKSSEPNEEVDFTRIHSFLEQDCKIPRQYVTENTN